MGLVQGGLAVTRVVDMGVLARGRGACPEFWAMLPRHTGVAVICVPHLLRKLAIMAAGMMAARSPLPLPQARQSVALLADHIDINAPGYALTLLAGRFQLEQAPSIRRQAAGIFDGLLVSLAQDLRARGLGVVQSGNGPDGSNGWRAVKDAGRGVIAQSPHDARARTMLESAISTGEVDAIIPSEDSPAALIRRSQNALAASDREFDDARRSGRLRT